MGNRKKSLDNLGKDKLNTDTVKGGSASRIPEAEDNYTPIDAPIKVGNNTVAANRTHDAKSKGADAGVSGSGYRFSRGNG